MVFMKEGRLRMAKLEDLGEVISTDVLVAGSGIAGLPAAIKAKEESPDKDVLIVDKATVGWGGLAPKGGGVFWCLAPEDDLEKFVEYHVKNFGYYLNDQELTYRNAKETYGAAQQLAEWGVKVQRDAQGKLITGHLLSSRWSHAGADLDMIYLLRAKARKLGVKILSKVQVVELLKQGNRVVGAVGLNVLDGRFYIIKAKSTVLATGGLNRTAPMFFPHYGEGVAAAYRAGAEMRNAEFGFFIHPQLKGASGHIQALAFVMCNAAGENLAEKYMPEIVKEEVYDTEIFTPAFIIGSLKEMNEGKIGVDLSRQPPRVGGPPPGLGWNRPKSTSYFARQRKLGQYQPPTPPNPEVEFGLAPGCAPVRVDHEMKTSLEGLWAVGDTSYDGSAWGGAVSIAPGRMRGSPLMIGLLGGLRSGSAAARYASGAAAPQTNYDEVKQLKDEIFAPMQRSKGLLPQDAIKQMDEIVSPVEYGFLRTKDRIEGVLSKLGGVRHKFSELYAKDGHGLMKCNEAKSMAVCLEIVFNAALARTESRGYHYREDYPEMDNKNWLKWVIVKQKDGKAAVSTEPVPIDRYKHKP
jgi:succinate dehydrogenase / fumarate reductase flavoprotein subunit